MSIILKQNINKPYIAVSVLGKSLKLNIKYRNNPIVELNKKDEEIELYLPKKYKNMSKIEIVNMVIEKMYDDIAETEIDNSMEKIRLLMGFAPEDYYIERMKDTFCKCTKNKTIIINPDIVKYSRSVIDTTLIQAFCQTQHSQNSRIYKETLENGIKRYENYKYGLINSQNIRKIARVS